jgi:GNAT superfamily N-acetyltransferase
MSGEASQSQPTEFRVERASAQHTEGLLALFDACDCRCFCRFFHFEGDNHAWLERSFVRPHESRAELAQALAQGSPEALGVVAVAPAEEEAVVGWLKLAPIANMRKRYEGRYYRGLSCLQGDTTGGFSLGCVLVRPDVRRSGVSKSLVEGAVREAVGLGARYIDAFPRVDARPLRDDELWTGPVEALRAQGFEPVHDEPPYPVWRRRLGP